jgi:hypothetical protein
MDTTFSDRQAITAAVVAIASAILGVLVAAGLDLSRNLTDHIIALITVVTPAVLVVIGWLHHNSAKVAVARTLADSGVPPTTINRP